MLQRYAWGELEGVVMSSAWLSTHGRVIDGVSLASAVLALPGTRARHVKTDTPNGCCRTIRRGY